MSNQNSVPRRPLRCRVAHTAISTSRCNPNGKTRSRKFVTSIVAWTFSSRSEAHTSELQSLMRISYSVFFFSYTILLFFFFFFFFSLFFFFFFFSFFFFF